MSSIAVRGLGNVFLFLVISSRIMGGEGGVKSQCALGREETKNKKDNMLTTLHTRGGARQEAHVDHMANIIKYNHKYHQKA